MFIERVFSGETTVEAYRTVYDKPNLRKSAVQSMACKLIKKPESQQYLAELRQKRADEAVMTRARRMRILSEQAEKAAEEGDRNGLAKMIDTLNRMDGAYEPEKVKTETHMSVASLVLALQEEGCRPQVH